MLLFVAGILIGFCMCCLCFCIMCKRRTRNNQNKQDNDMIISMQRVQENAPQIVQVQEKEMSASNDEEMEEPEPGYGVVLSPVGKQSKQRFWKSEHVLDQRRDINMNMQPIPQRAYGNSEGQAANARNGRNAARRNHPTTSSNGSNLSLYGVGSPSVTTSKGGGTTTGNTVGNTKRATSKGQTTSCTVAQV
mmetsp:Transcript_60341/g.95812  ORF Transcript_60341/g.95812 Transcript_60341/m.95812 type:complete len:191 (-) Transcript_60341:108-680(-)